MSHRCLAAVVTVLALVALTPILATAQSTNTATPPRTPWGHPDLQGVWDFSNLTPLERPDDLAGQEFLTEEEAANLEQQAVDRIEADARPVPSAPPPPGPWGPSTSSGTPRSRRSSRAGERH